MTRWSHDLLASHVTLQVHHVTREMDGDGKQLAGNGITAGKYMAGIYECL
jgi:hypothetical protein